MKSYPVGIIGAGNSAHALSASLSQKGHTVRMYARRREQLDHISKSGKIRAFGEIEGEFPIAEVTADYKRLCAQSSVIFFATITTAYPDIIQELAPYLTSDHVLVPFSSKLAGAKEIGEAYALKRGRHLSPKIIETDALFACRKQEDGSVWIRGIKKWNLYSCQTRTETLEFGPILSNFFSGLQPAENLIQRGLTDFGAVAHAVITLANLSRIDRGDDFLFYYDGLSERTILLLEAAEREFRSVAEAYDTTLMPMKNLLDKYYSCDTTSLLTAMKTVPNYRHSKAPTTLSHRYFQEDVASTLVPLSELAQKANIKTPMVDATINIAGVLAGRDFRTEGRSLKSLGWDKLSRSEIIREVSA